MNGSLNDEQAGNALQSPETRRSFFKSQGYLVLRGALDPAHDLEPLADAYSRLTDDLVDWVQGAGGPTIVQGYETMDFPGRFASLVGMTHGGVFNHIDPTLNVYEWGYRRWHTAPSAQPPELFDLKRNPVILDAVEEQIGSEIWVSSGYHVNVKLASDHLDQMHRAEHAARESGISQKPVIRTGPFNEDFQIGETRWHMDGYPGQGSEFEHNYIIAWVPLTSATADNGALVVLPGSHLNGYCKFPAERESEAIVLETQPGDIILMDGKVFHKAVRNRTRDSTRMAFNVRYSPIGFRCGRCFLPGFIGRSRTNSGAELHDPELWSASWKEALDFLYRYEVPVPHIELSVKQVDRLQKRWKTYVPDQESWLQLQRHGSFVKALRTRVMQNLGRFRYYLSTFLKIGSHYR